MRRFTREELDAFRGREVDDLLDEDHPVRLLFVGINPGLWTAAVGAHFARRGNRFWPALYRAGVTATSIDPSDGLSDTDRLAVLRAGVGITNIVPVATARADELTREQMRAGALRLRATVARVSPRVVAVLGVTAYRQAFGRPATAPGLQGDTLEGAALWVLGNPSGLNAHETVDSLAVSFREAALAAGVELAR